MKLDMGGVVDVLGAGITEDTEGKPGFAVTLENGWAVYVVCPPDFIRQWPLYQDVRVRIDGTAPPAPPATPKDGEG